MTLTISAKRSFLDVDRILNTPMVYAENRSVCWTKHILTTLFSQATLLAQSQQWKNPNNVSNPFKINNIDTRTT